MALPIPPYPQVAVREAISSAEWPAILNNYNAVLTHHLSLSPTDFLAKSHTNTNLHTFLTSFIHELSLHHTPAVPPTSPEFTTLKKLSFKLIHRLALLPNTTPPTALTSGQFLLSFANAFPRSSACRKLLTNLRQSHPLLIGDSLTIFKTATVVPELTPAQQNSKTRQAPSIDTPVVQSLLYRLSILFHLLPDAGEYFLAGDDFLGTLSDLYGNYTPLRPAVLRTAVSAFTGVLKAVKPNYSLIFDTLSEYTHYSSSSSQYMFLTALVSETTLLRRLRDTVATLEQMGDTARRDRMEGLISSLVRYTPLKDGRIRRPLHHRPRRVNIKGKEKAIDVPNGDISISDKAVASVTEVLPHLPTSYIRQKLIEHNGNVEHVIQGVLEGTLPPPPPVEPEPAIPGIPKPISTTITPKWVRERQNIYDSQPLPITPSSIHIGKKNPSLTADKLLNPPTRSSEQKQAILNALQSLADTLNDDERDDTYDVADVGGAVEATDEPDPTAQRKPYVPRPENPDEEAERYLYGLYTDPNIRDKAFARDADTRRSKLRMEMTRMTGWDNERIEGWAVMLYREKGRIQALERRFEELSVSEKGSGNPNRREGGALARTRWRGGDDDIEAGTEGDQGDTNTAIRGGRGGFGRSGWGSGGGGRGGYHGGRGRGGGRGGGVGNGPPAAGDARARAHKETHKASRANHNRREGYARKMARGMAGAPPTG